MPLHDTICPVVPGENFESQIGKSMIGVILSAMAYGGVLSLTLSYVSLLLKPSYDIPRRMRIFLLVYVTFMLAISTVYIIITIILFRILLSKSSSGSNNDCGQLLDLVDKMTYFRVVEASGACITLANWGADGFMLWRCVILYEGVSPPRRIALNAILGVMALMSLGSGLAFIINPHGFLYFQNGLLLNGILFFQVMTATTIIFNLVTATLITFRILYFDRHIRRTVGLERNNPYKTVIILCVESSALIVIFSSIYLILAFLQNGLLVPMQLLVHVYVISPLLIVYRVARGRTATISQRPSENVPVVSSLHFAPPSSSNNL